MNVSKPIFKVTTLYLSEYPHFSSWHCGTYDSSTFLLSEYFSATMSKADHDKMLAVESEDPSDGYVNQG